MKGLPGNGSMLEMEGFAGLRVLQDKSLVVLLEDLIWFLSLSLALSERGLGVCNERISYFGHETILY